MDPVRRAGAATEPDRVHRLPHVRWHLEPRGHGQHPDELSLENEDRGIPSPPRGSARQGEDRARAHGSPGEVIAAELDLQGAGVEPLP